MKTIEKECNHVGRTGGAKVNVIQYLRFNMHLWRRPYIAMTFNAGVPPSGCSKNSDKQYQKPLVL